MANKWLGLSTRLKKSVSTNMLKMLFGSPVLTENFKSDKYGQFYDGMSALNTEKCLKYCPTPESREVDHHQIN